MPQEWTIGRLAAAAGVNVETIRYYERRGLLEQPLKPSRGYRLYPARMADRIRFIKRAQALGFKLETILTLPPPETAGCCAETRKLAAQSLTAIERKLAELEAMRDALAELMRQCDSGQIDEPCPIIDILSRDI
jgi:MerR family mercuric resistance operon transcriptional regulator